MTCKICDEVNRQNMLLCNENRDLKFERDNTFRFTPLWCIFSLLIASIVVTAIAVKSFEYGAEQVSTGKLHCVTKDHNTMCEEVKK